MNRGEHETRILRSREMAAEDVGFPFAAQCARVLRIRPGREDEEVGFDHGPDAPGVVGSGVAGGEPAGVGD